MDVVLLTLWIWLPVVLAGVIRETDDGPEVEPSCETHTLNSVLQLDCSERGLTALPEELDYSAKVLLLSNNNFVSFPPQLKQFPDVEMLDLSGNDLTRPLPGHMNRWSSLHTVSLSNNNYDTWLVNVNMYSIRNLDLSKNKINKIDEDAFVRLPYLSVLDLSENRITDLPPTIFASAGNLDVLVLSRNYFSAVPSFQSSSLRVLRLSNCQILTIDVNAFVEMTSVIRIDLSINQIESIPDDLNSNTLQELDLSYNEISKLTDHSFSSLPHLAVLDLRGNEFKEVWSTSHFSSNPFLREVHVKGNRWSCEGFSMNLLLTYEYLTKEPPKITDSGSLICYSPSNVTNMSWEQAYNLTWNSNDSNSSESYTMMAVMIGIIIGVLITSFICRAVMSLNKIPPRLNPETTVLNANGGVNQPRADTLVMRIPISEDLPPTYEEALLMPRLNASFHSLPDFVDEEEPVERQWRRRSRSIGDLTESRPRAGDRRSFRRTVEIRINHSER